MMKIPTILVLAASIGTAAPGLARADETVKFRLVMHVTGVQTQEVPDVDGHTMSVIKFSGLASFPDGAVGTASLVATTDYIKGSGTFSNYVTVTSKDGSTITYKMTNAPAKPDGATTVFPEAPVTIVRGTGRWDGAKGDGSQSGARLTPLASGAELYADSVLNLKK
jgi:hypothetical protein